VTKSSRYPKIDGRDQGIVHGSVCRKLLGGQPDSLQTKGVELCGFSIDQDACSRFAARCINENNQRLK